jgi:hypothetical protein
LDLRGRKWRETEEDYIRRNIITRIHHRILLGSSKRVRWAGYVARIEEINAYSILVANLKGRDHLEDVGVDGRIILERILGKKCGNFSTGFIWLRRGTSGRLL